MLVKPATVDRWHRDGFARWWRRRSRRPGRPYRGTMPSFNPPNGRREPALACAADPRRVAQAGHRRLRTHRVTVPVPSTASTVTELEYIPDESPEPAPIPIVGAVMDASGADDVVAMSSLPFPHMLLFCDGLNTSHQCAPVDSLPRTSCSMPIVRDHRLDRVDMRHSGGRDPPTPGPLPPTRAGASRTMGRSASGPPVMTDRARPSASGRGSRISTQFISISVESVVNVARTRHVFVVSDARRRGFARPREYWRSAAGNQF